MSDRTMISFLWFVVIVSFVVLAFHRHQIDALQALVEQVIANREACQ